MSLTILIAVIVVGAIAWFLYRNPQLLGKAETNARIKADEALNSMTSDIEREKDAVKQLAARMPAQRERVAKIQSTVDETGRQLDTAVAERDGLKAQFESLQGRLSPAAQQEMGSKYSAAKAKVAEFEKTLDEAKDSAAEAEKTLAQFEKDLKKAEANITTDEGRAALAELHRENAKLRTDVDGMNSSLSAVGESRKQIQNDLDVARHLDENSKGSKTDREIKDAQDKLDAENALKELQGDVAKDKGAETK